MGCKMKISTYCKQDVPGWEKLPPILTIPINGNEDLTCGYVRLNDGIHIMASVRYLDSINKHYIHVSIAPIRPLRMDWTDEEHNGHIFDVTNEVLKIFFDDRKFVQQPQDTRRPEVKHYYSIIVE
jgi:hypothetical protein